MVAGAEEAPQAFGKDQNDHRILKPVVQTLHRLFGHILVFTDDLIPLAARLLDRVTPIQILQLVMDRCLILLRRMTEDIPAEMGLAALPGRVRKYPADRMNDPLMSIRRDQTDPVKPAVPKGTEEGFPRVFRFSRENGESDNLTFAFITNGYSSVSGLSRNACTSLSRSLQTAETVDLEKEVPHRISITRLTFRLAIPSTTIPAIVASKADSLRE